MNNIHPVFYEKPDQAHSTFSAAAKRLLVRMAVRPLNAIGGAFRSAWQTMFLPTSPGCKTTELFLPNSTGGRELAAKLIKGGQEKARYPSGLMRLDRKKTQRLPPP